MAMRGTYRYDHRIERRRRYTAVIVIVLTVGILTAVGYAIFKDVMNTGANEAVEGSTRVVGQVEGQNSVQKAFKETTFTMQVPVDWKETARTSNAVENSVTIASTKQGLSERSLKVYVDTIPNEFAVNRMLPLTWTGESMSTGSVSDNCATFTKGGTLDTTKSVKLLPAIGRWQGLDFWCDLANVVDNKIGTSSKDGINVVKVNGPAQGTHSYFFLYIDRNIQPDYQVLQQMLASFKGL